MIMPIITVAERDTAAAAQAAIGRQRAAHRLWLAAAAHERPAETLKSLFSLRMVNWTMLGVV